MSGRPRYCPTAEHLFGELARSSPTGHFAFLDRARDAQNQGRETAQALALAGYAVARLLDVLLAGTPESREGFPWHRDAVARHIRGLPQEVPEAAHLHGIVDAISPDRVPTPVLRIALTAWAYYLENAERFLESLEVLALSVRTHGSEISTKDVGPSALYAGRLNRRLGRWEPALTCYQAAEHAGRETGDNDTRLRSRLGLGAVMRERDDLPGAQGIVEEVIGEAAALGVSSVQGPAHADLAAIYDLQGRWHEGIQARYNAFLLTTAPADRVGALGCLASSLAQVGAYGPARIALQIVADAKTETRAQASAAIQLMDLESAVGNRLAFERHRSAAGACLDRLPPRLIVEYHYSVGVGLARFGQLVRGRDSLRRALEAAEAHALNTWYFHIERALKDLSLPEAIARTVEGPPELRDAPVIAEVERSLREYRAAMPA